MGDDWSLDLWDDLVKNKPEQWDIRDALRLGKRESQEDPSRRTKKQQREESPTAEKTGPPHPDAYPRNTPDKIYIYTRDWELHDLNTAVENGSLTVDQAFSIMRLMQATAKPKHDNNEDELIEAMWQHLKGDRGSLGEHQQSNTMEPRSNADGKETSSNVYIV